MKNRCDWLEEKIHLPEGSVFSIPKGILFLKEITPDIAFLDITSLVDRVAMFVWWESVCCGFFPNIKWTLVQSDIEALLTLSADELFSKKKGMGFSNRLKGEFLSISILDLVPGMDDLLRDTAPCDKPLPIALPRFLINIWSDRSDLIELYDINLASDCFLLIDWWIKKGWMEYNRITWMPDQNVFHILLKLDCPDSDNVFPLPNFLIWIYYSRPDLIGDFDLLTDSGVFKLLLWWESFGHNQYPYILWKASNCDDLVSFMLRDYAVNLSNLEGYISDAVISLPYFIHAIWQSRPDLQRRYDLKVVSECFAFLMWLCNSGFKDYNFFTIDFFLKLFDCILQFETVYYRNDLDLPWMLVAIWDFRPDLQLAFDIRSSIDIGELKKWFEEYGENEYPCLRFIDKKCIATLSLESVLTELNYSNLSLLSNNIAGVNIIGVPHGCLGVGEDARMAASALKVAGVSYGIIDAPIAGPDKIDNTFGSKMISSPLYPINLFCLPPIEMMRLSMVREGQSLLNCDTYNVGAWPWELPHWPAPFSKVREFVDEIWAQSEYVRACFTSQGDTPVYKMPMAVCLPSPSFDVRVKYGLPANSFLYYLMFDGNSWLSRKNPLSGVQAFQKAFSSVKQFADVGLVIKAMNVRKDDSTWQAIEAIAFRDSRIYIIDDRLERGEVVNFMASCDCYISLHRSEGFGRVIAEAMLLGQPVVVTNFSGNVDYCNSETAFLVDGDLVSLRKGDYLMAEGQYWCDPDVDVAAKKIQTIYENAGLRQNIAKAGQKYIKQNYSVEAVANAYKKRLNEITLRT